jgi:hypothetical protein
VLPVGDLADACGCRFIPVDKEPYAEAGHAAITSLGVYPGARIFRDEVVEDTCGNGWPDSCEVDHGPADGYYVTQYFALPMRATVASVEQWYARRQFGRCVTADAMHEQTCDHAEVYVSVSGRGPVLLQPIPGS